MATAPMRVVGRLPFQAFVFIGLNPNAPFNPARVIKASVLEAA
jgi:hypothetical protein